MGPENAVASEYDEIVECEGVELGDVKEPCQRSVEIGLSNHLSADIVLNILVGGVVRVVVAAQVHSHTFGGVVDCGAMRDEVGVGVDVVHRTKYGSSIPECDDVLSCVLGCVPVMKSRLNFCDQGVEAARAGGSRAKITTRHKCTTIFM